MSALRVLRQQIPLARSILWAPTSAPRPGDVAFPVFLRQSALQAIYQHLATIPPPGQGTLGFMLGDRCECPVTGVSYSVIDAALRLNQTIYGDRSRDVVTRLWKRLEAQLEAQQAHLIGWYHTHPPLPLELSVHDVETHEQYFSEPWQVGMLVGTDPATPAGAFFRAGSEETWVRTPQPFYELLNEDSVRPDGKKRSFMTWKTYRAYNPPALQPRAAASPPPLPRVPQEVDEPEEQPEPEESGREEPTGLEHMPQAELEEPRTELEEPPRAAPPTSVPARPTRAEDEEWEDPGALRFLSAAEDMASRLPPPPRSAAPPPRPPVPPFARVDSAPSDALPFIEGVDLPLEGEEEQDEPPERSAPPPPERRPARRTASRGRGRRWIRKIAFGLAGLLLLAAGGVATWQFGPLLLQQLRALAPRRHAPASDNPHRAAAPRPAAPRPTAPPPAVPRPAPTPRPEFALVDQAGDSLARALQAYTGRRRLFEKRQLDCLSLGRGMVRVERAVARYGVQRNATRATLDPDRLARDRELRAAVDSAGRQFQRSQCEHL